MNFFNQFMDAPESSDSSNRRSNSDEEVILASNRPKRSAGRKKFRETRHPVYRGVRQRNNDKWVCEVREPNKKTRIWLGTFQTAEMAARAHDVATLALRGRSACLNFADSIWRLPVPNSTDAKDIRKAATDAADAFRPSETEVATQEYSRQDSQDYSRQDSQDYSRQEDMVASTEDVFYMDEATEFGMPGLLANMAEGLLLSPPPMGSWSNCHDDMDSDHTEVSLWSYSI